MPRRSSCSNDKNILIMTKTHDNHHHSSSRSKSSKSKSKSHSHHHHSSSRNKSTSKSHRSQAGPPSTPSTIKTTEGHYHNTSTTAKDRIEEINERTTRNETRIDEEELALKRKLVPRLAKRAYHLEDDNTWCEDWVQYQRNTHPVFGLCLYHRFHPIRLPQRVIILVGSIGESIVIGGKNCTVFLLRMRNVLSTFDCF